MDISIITQYITPIIVIACLCVGYVIKHGIHNETVDSFIPLILATLGVIANIWQSGTVDLPTMVAGAVSGLASVGLWEAFTQILKLPALQQEATPELELGPTTESESPIVEEAEEYHGKHFNE